MKHWFFYYWWKDYIQRRLQSNCLHTETFPNMDSGYSWTECRGCGEQFNPRVRVELRDSSYCCITCGRLFNKPIKIEGTKEKFNYCTSCKRLYEIIEVKV